jgi:protein-tyrosine phosphatase
VSLPAGRGTPYRICLVCLGNICRSPIAAVVLMQRVEHADLPVRVDSAGTGDWHIGDQADHRARAALARAGYDGEEHRARQFDRQWFAERDLVLALDEANASDLRRLAPDDEARSRVRLLRSFDPTATGDLGVPDPYWGGDAEFDAVLALVERAVDGLVAALLAELA